MYPQECMLMSCKIKIFYFFLSTDISTEGRYKGDFLSKRYTPIPYENSNPQIMNLLIKVYRPNDYYPKGGRTSLYLDRIQIGECINIEYPYGNAFYRGEGEFIFKYI